MRNFNILFLIILIFVTVGVGNAQVITQDSLALVKFYNSTNDTTNNFFWINSNNWLSPDSAVGKWYGVTISNGRVTGLDLSRNNLTGTIPDSIRYLTGLDTLSLSGNPGITDIIPDSIGNLTNLTYLDLSACNLSGTIPSKIGALTNLQFLDLSSNQFTGSIPVKIGRLTNLTYLDLYNNQLSGTIPDSIGNLTNLKYLYLGTNPLSGSVPTQIGSLTQLWELKLNSNQLSGSIPTEIGNLVNLRILDFYQNSLTGSIPGGIRNCIHLHNLYLSFNQLTGSIPGGIGKLDSLIYLDLSHNQLSGTIPDSIGNLNQLQKFYLSNNQLTGSIPVKIGRLINLTYLDLYNNQLSGTIPDSIGNLKNLASLYLGFNLLTGTIPARLDSLKNLVHLDMSNNLLTGSLPNLQLPQLIDFYLNNNRLVDLPNLKGSNQSLRQLFVFNNKLTFEDIEPNLGILQFLYSPQDSVGIPKDTTVTDGTPATFSVSVGGTANHYQWMKNGIDINGETGRFFTINFMLPAYTGSYSCRITDSLATSLTLYSRPVKLKLSVSRPKITTAVYQNPALSKYIDIVVVSDVSLSQLPTVRVWRPNDTTNVPTSLISNSNYAYKGQFAFPGSGTYTIYTRVIKTTGFDSIQTRQFNVTLAKSGQSAQLMSLDSRARLDIQSGSVGEDTYFLSDLQKEGNETVYYFGPEKKFSEPFGLELTFEQGVYSDPGKLFIYHKEGNDWKTMRTQVYQKENKIKSYINQLGEFKIGYDPNYNGNNLVPSEFVLKQNYPNPFNPTTTIQYDLPEDGRLLITIYNILGQQVKTIYNGFQLAGSYTVQWDGRNEARQPAASGTYFYRIQSGRLVQTRKMMLLH